MKKLEISYIAFITIATFTAIFLLAPAVLIFPTSLTNYPFPKFPPGEITFKWYKTLLLDPEWKNALVNSLIISTNSSILTTIVGLLSVYMTQRFNFKWISLFYIPVLIPIVTLAVAYLYSSLQIKIYDTILALILSHIIINLPVSFSLIFNTLMKQNSTILIKAGRNLGANDLIIFNKIILPVAKQGVLTSLLVSFILSFNESVFSIFLTGTNAINISKKIWTGIQYEISPVTSSAASLSIAFSLLLVSLLKITLPKLKKKVKP